MLGAPLAAALLLMEGVGNLHGWQWLFILEGAATCLWGIVLAVSFCHPHNFAHSQTSREPQDDVCAK